MVVWNTTMILMPKLNYDFLRKEKCDTDEKLQKAMLRYDQEKTFR